MIQRLVVASLVSATLLITVSCKKDDEKNGKVEKISNAIVLQWNEIAFKAFGGPLYQHSLQASRINAMMHLAMHDALNAIQPKYATHALTEKDKDADPVTAAATAAYNILLNEIPSSKSYLDSALSQSLLLIPAGAEKEKGLVLGKKAAEAIINNRLNDGSVGEDVVPVPPSTIPGVYQGVPPLAFIFAPHWKEVKPFGMQTNSQFRSLPQPSLNSITYSKDYNEVKQLGKLNSAVRTTDQTEYAKFWYEFSEAGWNRVARTAATNKNLNLLETARLFALVDMAMADAYIAGWESKIHYNFWRPYTAIKAGDIDGNNDTAPDATWEPAEPTPPIQDYPSTHSALGNAAATVLARILGDNTAFTMTSFTAVPAGSTRSFSAFSKAANENADSRVMAGLHFRFSCVAGQAMGTKIGNWMVDTRLRPL
ncbi:MAG: vanadium-dependent haloperoxidase [Rhizobacter sp.]|nr:vanadium-dependent haloperoxidase [Ferruginibacter sp.]